MFRELPEDEGTHSWIDELHLMDLDKPVVLSGNWINAAIINLSQYIEQAIWSIILFLGWSVIESPQWNNWLTLTLVVVTCWLDERNLRIYYMPINQTLIVYMFINRLDLMIVVCLCSIAYVFRWKPWCTSIIDQPEMHSHLTFCFEQQCFLCSCSKSEKT